ncbi:MAG TPA: TetR/AcrR family transcriptional regulator [Solirubrobacterales bacterium]|nr:TetR/AcrR family transcriptional regulator [Solirubrobacterales bacterium]
MRPTLPPEFIALHKRNRIMAALAELTAEKGYEATKISDVVKRAAVARKTLYDNFSGKEEVFLGAFDAAVEEIASRVEEACTASEGGWEDAVEAGLEALLAYVAEEPAMARLCLIDAQSATAASTERYERTMQRFIELARQSLPHEGPLPATVDEAVVGGVAHILSQELRRDRAAGAPELLPELREFVVGQYRTPVKEGAGKRR